jgi:integrase
MRLPEIRRAHISALHGNIKAPGAANRALSVVSAILNWASAEHDDLELPSNPAKRIRRNPERGCERFLTSEEFARLGGTLREGRTILDPFAVAAIRLLIFTGARLREILHAKWEHIDFERNILFLSDSKTGRKPIYLSAPALAVLATLPRIQDNPHLIPGRKAGEPRESLDRPWAAIRKAAGLEGVRLHDLRHSFASVGAGASFGLPIIGKLLGHSQAATTHRYAHLDADPVRRAAETIAATIAAAMDSRTANAPTQLRKNK